jgi:hypothetical protein
MKLLRRAVSMIVLSSAIAMPLLPIIGDAPAVATCGPLFATGGISLPNAVHQQIRSKECRVSGPVAELLLKGAADEHIAEVEAIQRAFQERRRTHPSPLHSDGGQAA